MDPAKTAAAFALFSSVCAPPANPRPYVDDYITTERPILSCAAVEAAPGVYEHDFLWAQEQHVEGRKADVIVEVEFCRIGLTQRSTQRIELCWDGDLGDVGGVATAELRVLTVQNRQQCSDPNSLRVENWELKTDFAAIYDAARADGTYYVEVELGDQVTKLFVE